MSTNKRRLSKDDGLDESHIPAKRLRPHVSRDSGDCDYDCDCDCDPGDAIPISRASLPAALSPSDLLSSLPHELIIRVLAFMSETELLTVSLVSKRFHSWASDSQLWREHYFRRFILPRAHLIPGFRSRRRNTLLDAPFSSKAEWTNHRRRAGRGLWRPDSGVFDLADEMADAVDWKQGYKTRHNWSRGSCAVDDFPDDRSKRHDTLFETKTLVKVVDRFVVTADWNSGLRAWNLRSRQLLAQMSLVSTEGLDIQPTCLAVDEQRLSRASIDIAVGFEDGSFGVWRLDLQEEKLVRLYRLDNHCYGNLVAVAYSYPYLFTATKLGFITLYTFDYPVTGSRSEAGDSDASGGGRSSDASLTLDFSSETGSDDGSEDEEGDGSMLLMPRTLTSLKSHSTRPPLALSIRKTPTARVASIAYSFDAVGGWCIGIQDFDIKRNGREMPQVAASRVAYTLPTRSQRAGSSSPNSSPQRPQSQRSSADECLDHPTIIMEPEPEQGPVRLSYSHPYLLAALPDNTLALHLCTATAESLSIAPQIRLWGHTSGISDAEITARGKAVSVSTRGDEIRVWELEGRVGGSSVEVRPRQSLSDAGVATIGADGLYNDGNLDLDARKNWVGFNDEVVLVMKSLEDGRTSLTLYDFT